MLYVSKRELRTALLLLIHQSMHCLNETYFLFVFYHLGVYCANILIFYCNLMLMHLRKVGYLIKTNCSYCLLVIYG